VSPFRATDNAAAAAARVLGKTPEPVTFYRSDLTDIHVDIVNRTMAQDRSRRLRSAVHLLERIREITGETIQPDIQVSSPELREEDAAHDASGSPPDAATFSGISRPRKIVAALLVALIAAGLILMGIFLSQSW
jgi:hypothetical protein